MIVRRRDGDKLMNLMDDYDVKTYREIELTPEDLESLSEQGV